MQSVCTFQECEPVLLPPLSDVEQGAVSLPDKFRCSEVYRTLSSTLQSIMSLPFEEDKWSSLQRQGGVKKATYASSFLRQVCGVVLVLVLARVMQCVGVGSSVMRGPWSMSAGYCAYSSVTATADHHVVCYCALRNGHNAR